jgi:hypothetical protein
MSTSPRQNRTITVDFKDEATYHRLCQDGKNFINSENGSNEKKRAGIPFGGTNKCPNTPPCWTNFTTPLTANFS